MSSEDERLSKETISDSNNYCREVTLTGLDHLYETTVKIGGHGHVVQVDESKEGKRK